MSAVPRAKKRRVSVVIGLAATLLLGAGLTGAYAAGGGGTGKPPPGSVAPFVTPTLADPAFQVDPATIHGFDDSGLLQDATVSQDNTACPDVSDPHRWGGSVVIHGTAVTVPCNMVIQMPANTFRWADFVNGGPSLALKDLGSAFPSPSFEMRVVGNIVGSERIAGLMFASQQSVNTNTGVITGFDFAHGVLQVDTETGPSVVQINDPKISDPTINGGHPTGRFSAGQSPDERFSVDQGNPTVHSATGFPMCIPRTDPASGDDPLCPQQNRPHAASGCRNFSQAGLSPLPQSGELTAPAADQVYCSQFVMPAPPSTGSTTGPDAREQAPFEVGDSITYSGTLVHGAAGDSSRRTPSRPTSASTPSPARSPATWRSASSVSAPQTRAPRPSTAWPRRPRTGSSWKPRPPT